MCSFIHWFICLGRLSYPENKVLNSQYECYNLFNNDISQENRVHGHSGLSISLSWDKLKMHVLWNLNSLGEVSTEVLSLRKQHVYQPFSESPGTQPRTSCRHYGFLISNKAHVLAICLRHGKIICGSGWRCPCGISLVKCNCVSDDGLSTEIPGPKKTVY